MQMNKQTVEDAWAFQCSSFLGLYCFLGRTSSTEPKKDSQWKVQMGCTCPSSKRHRDWNTNWLSMKANHLSNVVAAAVQLIFSRSPRICGCSSTRIHIYFWDPHSSARTTLAGKEVSRRFTSSLGVAKSAASQTGKLRIWRPEARANCVKVSKYEAKHAVIYKS